MTSDRRRRQELAYEVVRLTQAGRSQREIARSLGIARKTVRKLLDEIKRRREQGESAVERLVGRPRVPKASKLDDFDDQIREWLHDYHDMTAVRCLEKLQEMGFGGGYTIVRERLKKLRLELDPPEPAVVVETAPGQRSEFDWSPYKLQQGLKVQTWSNTLCWSHGVHLAGSEDQKQTKILTFLREGFEEWKGVPHECMTDSMPGVVDRWECNQPIINARFIDFAAHYGFTILIAPRACPKFKARVERNFRYHEGNLLNARDIYSFQQYVELLEWWCREKAMRRPHPKTKREIWSMLEEERAYLLPLPARPYDTRDVFVRVINPKGYVHLETNKYPVPGAPVGERVYVCVDSSRVEVCDRKARRLIEHERLPDGAGIELPQMDSSRRRGRYDLESLIDQVAEWGETAEDFARGVRKAKRFAGPQLAHLLSLQLNWSLDDIVAAIRHALDYRCYDVDAVRKILEARFTPRRFEAAIADSTRSRIQQVMKDHPVGHRPLSSYDSLREGDFQTTETENDDDQE